MALAGHARTHDSLQRPDFWIVAQQTLAIELGTTGRTAGAASRAEATSAAECTAISRPIRDRSTCRAALLQSPGRGEGPWGGVEHGDACTRTPSDVRRPHARRAAAPTHLATTKTLLTVLVDTMPSR